MVDEAFDVGGLGAVAEFAQDLSLMLGRRQDIIVKAGPVKAGAVKAGAVKAGAVKTRAVEPPGLR